MSLKLQLQENVPLEEVFQTLRCDSHGLTSEAAQQRLAIFGHNKLEEKQVILLDSSAENIPSVKLVFCCMKNFFF